MLSFIYHVFFYNPLYNALVFLIDLLPGFDVGLAVIVLTIIVKLILFPLSYKAIKTQSRLKIVQVEIDEAKKEYKDKQEELAKIILGIYKKHNINPFAGFLTLLIQIPILLALYFIFVKGGLPTIHTELLYSFIPIPEKVNMMFLGLFDVSKRSIGVAILVGITQYIQAMYAFPKPASAAMPLGTSFKDDFMKGLHLQMKYVLPIMMFGISLSLIAVVPIYWVVSNLFMIGQELYMRKKGIKTDHLEHNTREVLRS